MRLISKKMYKKIQLSKFIELINFSNLSYIFLLGCDSGNKIFNNEQIEINSFYCHKN